MWFVRFVVSIDVMFEGRHDNSKSEEEVKLGTGQIGGVGQLGMSNAY